MLRWLCVPADCAINTNCPMPARTEDCPRREDTAMHTCGARRYTYECQEKSRRYPHLPAATAPQYSAAPTPARPQDQSRHDPRPLATPPRCNTDTPLSESKRWPSETNQSRPYGPSARD